MNIFLYEFICGGGLAGQPLPDSLRVEGLAMLRSVAEDFSRIPGCEIALTLDERFKGLSIPGQIHFARQDTEKALLLDLAQKADFCFLVAPETGGILLERSRWADSTGSTRIGPSLEAIALATDKHKLSSWLCARGIPSPVGTMVHPEEGLPSDFPVPAVIKPVDGAGSQATFVIRKQEEMADVAHAAVREGLRRNALLQPFVTGIPASVSFLVGPGDALALPPCHQILSEDGRFRYLGGLVPMPEALTQRAIDLATRAVKAVPGLQGWIGVDLVLGEKPAGDVAIEINPRLTTSYVGLRAKSLGNLAESLLQLFQGPTLPELRWSSRTILFRSDGTHFCRPDENQDNCGNRMIGNRMKSNLNSHAREN